VLHSLFNERKVSTGRPAIPCSEVKVAQLFQKETHAAWACHVAVNATIDAIIFAGHS
jgi:hypothetical protein